MTKKKRVTAKLFLNILDFKLIAVDGQKVKEPYFLRLDSHGRVFKKSREETGGLWERVSDRDLKGFLDFLHR